MSNQPVCDGSGWRHESPPKSWSFRGTRGDVTCHACGKRFRVRVSAPADLWVLFGTVPLHSRPADT